MANTLQTINIHQPVTPPPPSPMPIIMAAPVSYEFRVMEYEKDGRITKVELQVKMNQHDQYGMLTLEGAWNAVERVRITE